MLVSNLSLIIVAWSNFINILNVANFIICDQHLENSILYPALNIVQVVSSIILALEL